MNKTLLWSGIGHAGRVLNRLAFPLQKDTASVIRFDTSIGTDNLGDNIIMYYCSDFFLTAGISSETGWASKS